MRASPTFLMLGLSALAAACSDGTGPHDVGATARAVRIVTPRASEPFGTANPMAYVVQVVNASGQPVVGATVEFQSAGGPATLSTGEATTDSGGLARTSITLTDGTGVPGITATVRGSSASVTGAPLLRMNANLNTACSAAGFRAARIAAVSHRALVLADTANPAGGLTAEDYASFAVTFDTLVDPLLRSTFGDPTDLDANGRVVLFFTSAINALTPSQATAVLDGYFHQRDLYPRGENAFGACPTSNEGEILYLLAADPTGTINGNKRDTAFVRRLTLGIAAHEYQHLINAGRRMYVNGATSYEELWLNEGLSHMAEELVYYRAAGLSPRQDLGGAEVASDAFAHFQRGNILRLRYFLAQSSHGSPYGATDDLATRGAIWDLLRYLADHRSTGDADTWFRLVNTTQQGLTNLGNVFGSDVMEQIRSWATSIATDDLAGLATDTYLQPSWNLPSLYAALDTSGQGTFPLKYVQLANGASTSVLLPAGGAAYLEFSVAAGQQASIDWQPSGSPALTTTACQSNSASTPAAASVTPLAASSGICLGGGDAGAQYVLIPFFASSAQSGQTSMDVYASGIEASANPVRVATGQALRGVVPMGGQEDMETVLQRRAVEQLAALGGRFGRGGGGRAGAGAVRNVAVSSAVEFTVVRTR